MDTVTTKLTVSQSARVTGKTRQTLYRHIDTGKVSAEKDGLNNTVIDLSELQRVYGELDISRLDVSKSNSSHSDKNLQTETVAVSEELLRSQLLHMEELLEIERERRKTAEEEKNQLLQIVEKQNLMLAAPQEPKGFFKRLFAR